MQGLLAASAGITAFGLSANPRFCLNYRPVLWRKVSGARLDSAPPSVCHHNSVLRAAATLAENAGETDADANTVKVKFVLQKKCEFGQQFNVVGEDAQFGAWDPAAAIPLEWSEGHIWTTELDVSVGKRIEFKFILTSMRGELEWQPGPNRVLETSEASSRLLVSESWCAEENIGEVPLEHIAEIVSPSDAKLDQASIISHVSSSYALAETPANATVTGTSAASVSADSSRDTMGEEAAKKASDPNIVIDPELPLLNRPVASNTEETSEDPQTSEDPTVIGTIDDPSKGPEPRLSVLGKDLEWGRKALSNLLWGFGQKAQRREETQ